MNTTKLLFQSAGRIAAAALVLFFLSAPGLFSRGVQEPSFEPAAPIPRDPSTITGVLDNGLAYYVRRNTRPENRAELRLVVNAGSILEDEDQRGLAHFVEHMAFNGTRNFAKQDLVNWLESIGMRFGPETNAYTSFDETVYQLEVPTDKKETIETALLILEDWAQGLLLTSDDIEKERGVILEEWRLGRGASARIRDVQFPTLLSGSLYAQRLPIGTPEVIQNAPPETLRRFYRDWYRPDLMAVVAVGDFHPDEMERMIRSRFSRLANPGTPRPRVSPPVPDHPTTLVASATDPEQGRTTIGIYAKGDAKPPITIEDYRSRLAEGLFFSMLNSRYDEESRRPGAPFLYAYAGSTGLARPKKMYYAAAAVDEDGIEEGFAALVRELNRVRTHGFTVTELERAKAEYLRGVDQTYREMENIPSGSFVSLFVDNFLENSPMMGPEYSHKLAFKYIPGIRAEEVLKAAEVFLLEKNRVALIGAPEKAKPLIPSDDAILRTIREAAAARTEPYVDDAIGGDLMTAVPAPGAFARIDGETARAAGVAEWRLGNGARVVLKTTDFKNDELLMTAFSPGGTSLASDEDFISADFAENLAGQSGVGRFSRVQLEKLLSGKKVSLETAIGRLTENLQGSASTRDLEAFFQMIHLTFTDARLDKQAAEAYLRRTRASLANQENQPEEVYFNTITEILTQGHPRGRPLRAALVDKVNPERSFEFLKDRFRDAGDFTFIFVGSVSPEILEPYIAAYLASLPGGRGMESWKDSGLRLPKRGIEKTVKAGIEQKSLAALYFTGDFRWSYEEVQRFEVMKEYLDLRLREILREDQGGTYGVSVSADVYRYPAEEYSLEISFGAAPDRVEDLVKTALAEIERLKTTLPDEKDAAKIREQSLRLHERGLKENGYYLNTLRTIYFHGLPGGIAESRPDFIKTISPVMIRDALAAYCDPSRLVQVLLLPADVK